ncbi:MAG: ABC transporter permease [Oscillospiraceae bacterium]|nr:ABC transporter permease [Oscillospiraceae bacterium]
MKKTNDINNIPREKFTLVQENRRLSDQKFEDKPIGYFKDAWIRFRKNKGSIVAAIIILIIVLFSLAAPLLITSHSATFMDVYYAKKPSRDLLLSKIGISQGTTTRTFSEAGLVKAVGIGVAAEDRDGSGTLTVAEGLTSYYQPIRSIGEAVTYSEIKGAKPKTVYNDCTVENYLEVGFIYKSIEQAEYARIVAWQEETGIQVLYPLVQNNEYNMDASDANYWYKSKKGQPVTIKASGKAKTVAFSEDLVLEDNYKRDAEGNPVYYEYTGGGTHETAQFKVRVLYYNYYRYLNGAEPEYIFGTDSQGYDLALRLAGGIRLSLLLAICVSAINLTIGAIYGAIEGYYGGAVDLILERVSDILWGIPFIVTATLFQMHLAKKVGPIPSLLFAFVLTGWLSTAYRTRTQFYRFKGQEYVLAARTLGAKDWRIIWKHIFPNALGTIITSSVLVIPGVISSESMLSYLGIVKLGDAQTTSLGTLLSDAAPIWTNYPHLLLYPALVLALLMICFNLFGNGLRDAFNPSLRGVEE